MLLGLSGEENADELDLVGITGSGSGDGGIASGELLVRFAEAVHAEDGLAELRDEVKVALGDEGLVDAAAVCANFNMMVRIADGTGTPLDAGTVEISGELRDQLGLDDLVSRRVAETG